MYRAFGKRILDFAIALLGLPFFGILFLLVAPAIHLTDGGPVFYNAKRLGRRGRVFTMYKFRSMKVPPKDEHRRDPAASQRPQGGHEHRRPAAVFDDALRGV